MMWPAHLFAFVLILLISACTGDSRPLKEAIEASNLELVSLAIGMPAGLVDPLFVNSGQQVQFSLQGVNLAGTSLDLSSTDRRWTVSDSAVANVTRDGVLVGRMAGSVLVSVRLGGIVAPAFPVTVSDAQLSQISSIEGATSVDRCRPSDYSAIGTFDDGTRRGLSAVEWTLNSGASARLSSPAPGGVELTGFTASALTLGANVDDISLQTNITVEDTLITFEIVPAELSLAVGESATLDVQAQYQQADTTDVEVVAIGSTVEKWQVVTGPSAASISSTGRVSGLAVGTATVQAVCGDTGDTRIIIVAAASTDENLIFNTNSPLTIKLNSLGFGLRVATGTRFTNANDVTKNASWELISGNSITLSSQGTTTIEIAPIRLGSSEIRVTYLQSSRDFVVVVE